MKKTALFLSFAAFSLSFGAPSFSQGLMEATSTIDWTAKMFQSTILFDMEAAGLTLPSGKSAARGTIDIKMPSLLKEPLLAIFVDSSHYLGDLVQDNQITLEQIARIVENGRKTPTILTESGKSLRMLNTIDINEISRQLVKHNYPYTQEEPLDAVSTRSYTGIIIDARGMLPVHGEYISSAAYPCFFPQVWDEGMNIIYERNVVARKIAEQDGIACYDSSDDFSLYEKRVGVDPLYIKAYKIYGRHRTDPIIRRKDALKIITNAENRRLLSNGKVVILLDKPQLVYDVTIPQKQTGYYATYSAVKQYVYENKVPDINVSDSVAGILFSVDLKFKPDSSELLPDERPRIQKIAEMLKEIIRGGEFTILVEGHTADIGRPEGQMNLSIERTRAVMQELVAEGVPESLFSYKGYGGTQPIATNETEAGRSQNRRVDITARPKATYIMRE